jgi:hypothetical protein
MVIVIDSSIPSLSLRKLTEEDNGHQEIGQYENIRITVGYFRNIRAYYVKLSDIANGNESVLLTDRSDVGYLRFAHTVDFISALHAALDAKGMYLDGNEEELAGVVSNLTLQLMERIRNEEP